MPAMIGFWPLGRLAVLRLEVRELLDRVVGVLPGQVGICRLRAVPVGAVAGAHTWRDGLPLGGVRSSGRSGRCAEETVSALSENAGRPSEDSCSILLVVRAGNGGSAYCIAGAADCASFGPNNNNLGVFVRCVRTERFKRQETNFAGAASASATIKNPRLKGSKTGGENALIWIKAPAQGGEAGDDSTSSV